MQIISVDFQRDFTDVGGACYQNRPCVNFIHQRFIPYCRDHKILIAEIISDYRQPRPGAPFAHCVPGTEGYKSALPEDVRHAQLWVKCMHSPVWVRENGGQAGKTPGLPYPDPKGFSSWLTAVVGPPEPGNRVVLIGLTLDCCVLCVAQELFFRGYQVAFLNEAVDTYNGSQEEKQALFYTPLANWGQPVLWGEISTLHFYSCHKKTGKRRLRENKEGYLT